MSDWNLFYQEPNKPLRELHPLVLAYAGDAIYELYVRQHVITKRNHKLHHLNQSAVRYVSAKAQAYALSKLTLNEAELEIVKRGRNAKSGTIPKNADVLQYRHSTAFECLLGYLYYAKESVRLREIMGQAVAIIDRDE